MDTLTADMETFYDKDYSLSKLSTQQYIDDPRFETIGVSVKRNNEPAVWFSGTHEETKDWLYQFDWVNSMCIAHNALFDASILAWRYGIKPKIVGDTLSMARAIHGTEVGGSLAALAKYYQIGEKGTEVINALGKRRVDFEKDELERYGEYCINDTELTYELFKKLAPNFNKTEINLIDMTIRMHSEPKFVLDLDLLEQHLYDVRNAKEKLLTQCGISKEDLMSNDKFAEVLRMMGVEPPTKTSVRTGKESYAFAKTDDGLKELLDHKNPLVQSIVGARLGVKSTLEETRTEGFIKIAHTADALPIGLKYYGAEVTGRWSATEKLQLQNIPRNSKLKEAIKAPAGTTVIGVDLSNIELRVNLYFSGQLDKLQIIADGKDLYKDFASIAFNVGYDEVNKEQRFIGKTATLGLGFGSSAPVLRQSVKTMSGTDIGEDESQRIVDVYRKEHPSVKASWYQGGEVLNWVRDNMGGEFGVGNLQLPVHGEKGILLPSGLYIKYPDLKQSVTEDGKMEWTYAGRRNERRRIYSSKVHQNVVQALARCVLGEAMVRINKRYRVNLTVHDAVYVIVPETEAQDAYDFILQQLVRPPKWMPGIPLDAEGGFGKSLKDC